MNQFQSKQRQLGNNIFHIRPLPAFTAANISGEIFGIILPALGSLAPIIGAKADSSSLLDIDSQAAAKAVASGISGISGEKLEHLLKKLLVAHRNISFEPADSARGKSAKPQLLTEDIANDVFCGDVQDMFILAFDVIRSNYSGFFEKLGSLFGDAATNWVSLINKAQPSLADTAL